MANVIDGVTLDPCDASTNAVLSNQNLTIKTGGGGIVDAVARASGGQSTGKWYFEMTPTDIHSPGGSHMAFGLCQGNAAFTANSPFDSNGIGARGAILVCSTLFQLGPPYKLYGNIIIAGATVLANSTDVDFQFSPFNTLYCAVDLDAKLIWFKSSTGVHWNANPLGDPASGVGGFSIAALSTPLFPVAEATVNTAEGMTVNYGESPFVGIPPTGFNAGFSSTGGTPGIGVPSGLATGAITTSSIALTWSPPAGVPPLSYTVQYRVTGTSTWSQAGGISGTSTTVMGLLSGTQYDFSVLAVFLGGPCALSNVVQQTTTGVPLPVQTQSLHRWRGQVGINWLGLALVGDAFSAVVGRSDFENFTEYGQTMRLLVTTPPVQDDRKRIYIPRFEVDMQVGDGLPSSQTEGPQAMLDYSRDGGMTFLGLQKWRSMGLIGAFKTRLRWLGLGAARTWVFRLQITDPVRRQIIGTYIDGKKGSG